MDFARLWEQAKDLWSRPVGKLIMGGLGVFLVAAAIVSYVWTRPTYVTLGKFEAANATAVAKKLGDSKIPFKNDANFTFTVPSDRYDDARLALADLNLDPTSTIWGIDSWKGKTSWSDTEFDKRRLWEEQTETNLARAIKTMSVVENARVDITLPSEPKLFASQDTPPKATVMVQPKKGQQLTTPMVESIMEAVSGAVEGLDKNSVVVIDSSRSKVVSADAFQEKSGDGVQPDGQQTNVQLQVQKEYTDRWTQMLTDQLEKVAGPGNVSVLVNPTINWERVQEEMQQYTPSGTDGKGMILSQSTKKNTSDGTAPATAEAGASGTTPNVEMNVPGYPGTTTGQGGTMSAENVENITNYLVNQTKRITDKPGGSIEEVSVGVFLNTKTVDATTEQAMQRVVANAMGSKAQVEVAAVPFAPSLWDDLANKPATTTPTPPRTPSLLYVLLAIAGTLGIIGFGMLAFRPKKPILEPVFAGPEAAMMGGIPVSELEMAAAADAYASQAAQQPAPSLSIGGEAPEEIEAEPLAPEEIALLGDDFLKELGVDPAKVRMREKVEKVAKANPEAVAQLLKTWIQDG